jgi:Na+-transporting methylmalonyl-CoA/oxaloacetate decarboxylase gamma subunit
MDTIGMALVVGGMAFLFSGLIFLIPVRGNGSQQQSFEDITEQTEEYLREIDRNRGIEG